MKIAEGLYTLTAINTGILKAKSNAQNATMK